MIEKKENHLVRKIGLLEATFAGVGIIIGAGIYILIGAASGYGGNAVWLSFIIAAFVAFLTGLSYAELSSIYTEASGEYTYIEHTFGKTIAFVIGYLVVFSLIAGAAAVSLGFSSYFSILLGMQNIIPSAIGIIVVLSIVNLIGIRQSIKMNMAFTIAGILGLLFIIIFSIPRFDSVNYMELPFGFQGVLKAASLIFFAYIGFESVTKLSEETRNPKRNIPLAILLSIAVSTLVYVGVALASVSVLGWEALSSSAAPLADVAFALMGANAWFALVFIALVSTGSTILISLIATSRVLYSMSHDFPRIGFLSAVNRDTKTPHNAIILTGLAAVSFVTLGHIEIVAEIANFSIFCIFIAVNLALIKLRYMRHKKERFHEPFSIGRFPITALFGVIITLLMIAKLEILSILIGAVITLSSLPVFYLIRKREISGCS